MGMDSKEEDGGNENRTHLSFHIRQPEKSPGGVIPGGVSFCLPGEGGTVSNFHPSPCPSLFEGAGTMQRGVKSFLAENRAGLCSNLPLNANCQETALLPPPLGLN